MRPLAIESKAAASCVQTAVRRADWGPKRPSARPSEDISLALALSVMGGEGSSVVDWAMVAAAAVLKGSVWPSCRNLPSAAHRTAAIMLAQHPSIASTSLSISCSMTDMSSLAAR